MEDSYKKIEADFFNYAQEMLALASLDGLFLHLNPMFEKTLGWSDEEMKSKPFFEFVHPDDVAATRKAVQTLANGELIFNFENRYRCKDGSYKWIEWKSKSDVQRRWIYAAGWDVDERKRMEERLRTSRRRLRNFIDASPFGILFYHLNDQDELILSDASKSVGRILGVDLGPHFGQSIHEVFPDLQRTPFGAKYRDLALKGGHFHQEDVRYQDASISGVYSIYAFQTAPREMAVMFEDISQQRIAEINLQESEKRFNRLMETVPVGIFVTRGDYITRVNQYFLRMLKYQENEVVGHPVRDFVSTEEEARQLFAFHRSKGRNNPLQPLEINLISWQHKGIPVLLSSAELLSDEEPREFLSCVLDIRDQRKAEEERLLFERQMQHSQRLESLGVLAGGIAHDFNNILLTITGNLDLALFQLKGSGQDEAVQFIRDAQDAVKRSTELTRQMLAYAGKGKFQKYLLNLSAYIDEISNLLWASVSKLSDLTFELDPAVGNIIADPGQIQQIVLNLVVNASEAIGDSKGHISVSTGQRDYDAEALSSFRFGERLSPGRYVFLKVSDTGKGMTEEIRSRLFEPFYTTKFTGRGLGLSSALGIVKNFKGAISLTSAPGKGTTFVLLFPSYGEVEGLEAYSTRRVPEVRPLPILGKILVVDDEYTIRKVAKHMLNNLGYHVLLAVDGEDAIERFHAVQDEFGLVILDLTMPKRGGTSVYHEIRLTRPDINILLSSGYSEQPGIQELLRNPHTAFLQKPYTIYDLQQAITLLIDKGAEN